VEWHRVLWILGVYEARTGQKLNLQKTSLFFSRNRTMDRRMEILNISGLTKATRIDSYLGLPTLVGRSKI
jgi:hypothetical protein